MILPVNPFNPDSQAYALYERIKDGGNITTKEIHRMGMDCARIRSDIRPILRGHGFDYLCKWLGRGNRLYQIVEGGR